MTALAALTIADGATTPVNHTFSPDEIDSLGVARWVDRVGGIAVGFPSITHSIKRPKAKGSRSYRVVTKVTVPVLEQTSPSTATGIQPAPTKAFDLIFNGEFVLPERSTPAQRNDLLAFVRNYFANAQVIPPAVQSFEATW